MASTTVVTQKELATQRHCFPYRPWFALYHVYLKQPGAREESELPLALIQQLLPEELLLAVFTRLPLTSLAAAQCVCRQWASVGAAQSLWREACRHAFFASDHETNCRLLKQHYRGCWKTMLRLRPHLRFDGIYVSRNTYLKTGVVEWRVKHATHLVLYFRYYRFMPEGGGTFLYRTSPEPLSRVYRSLQAPSTSRRQREEEQVQAGRFKLVDDRLYAAMRYDNNASTEVRSRLLVRSTVPGANNRLDIESIVSYDRADGQAVDMAPPAGPDDEVGELEGEQRSHRRGLSPYVFVPWDQMQSSVVNLPISQMDVWLPG